MLQLVSETGLSVPRAAQGEATGPVLDAQARSEYKEQLESLRGELAEAESFGDAGRASRAREGIEFLTEELARAVGLGGRDRRAAGAAERARTSATVAIKRALKVIGSVDRALASHLEKSIRTGTFCSYDPDPSLAIQLSL